MPNSHQFQPVVSYDLAAAIATGQTMSAEVDLSGTTLCGIFMPAGFTGSSLIFSASTDSGGIFQTVQDGAGADFTLLVSPGKYIPINNLAIFSGLRFIKLQSDAPEAATRSLILAVRSV